MALRVVNNNALSLKSSASKVMMRLSLSIGTSSSTCDVWCDVVPPFPSLPPSPVHTKYLSSPRNSPSSDFFLTIHEVFILWRGQFANAGPRWDILLLKLLHSTIGFKMIKVSQELPMLSRTLPHQLTKSLPISLSLSSLTHQLTHGQGHILCSSA